MRATSWSLRAVAEVFTRPVDALEDADPPPGTPRPVSDPGNWYVSDLANQLATGIVAVVCCCFGLLAAFGLIERQGPESALVAVPLAVAMLTIQLGYFSRPRTRLVRWKSVLALLAQAVLAFAPISLYGALWLGFPGFLAAGLLIALPAIASIPLFIGILVAAAVLNYGYLEPGYSVLYTEAYGLISTFLTGIVIFGLTRLARLVGELHSARDELSRMAVAEERLRWARDTHDVLGMSLSTITLKSELSHRLLGVDTAQARNEITEILSVARQALADVRMIASGRNTLSLPEELQSARSVLDAAQVTTTASIETTNWTPESSAMLATALREAVTNILRHSKAENASIRVWEEGCDIRLSVRNDGADHGDLAGGPGSGNGLVNLRQRVAEVGGELIAHGADGCFQLVLSVPARG